MTAIDRDTASAAFAAYAAAEVRFNTFTQRPDAEDTPEYGALENAYLASIDALVAAPIRSPADALAVLDFVMRDGPEDFSHTTHYPALMKVRDYLRGLENAGEPVS